jgi:uncharacterized protein (TIGR01244 family)
MTPMTMHGYAMTPRRAWVAAGLLLTCLTTLPAVGQAPELPNRKDPLAGITTAGQPTAEQLAAAAAAGYKSVIDLRTPSENRGMADEKATVEGLGMSYVNLPVDGAGGVSYANAAALDELLRNAEQPVLLHCASANRAGALLALRAKLEGADDDTALALGVAGGVTGLKATVEERLAQGPPQPTEKAR